MSMSAASALLDRISGLDFDDLDAEFPFSARLARDNGWSRAFARRAIEEYRRFVCLAMTAGHEVTPSDEVDQVWHLHLTYTRHYWGPFREALGRPLHHGPTEGGHAERTRYRENYEATLSAYEAAFGFAPPRDLWPSPDVRFADASHVRRVNTRSVLLISRKALRRAGAGMAAAMSGAALFGVSMAAEESDGALRILQWIEDNPSTALLGAAIAVFVFAILGRALNRGRRGDGGSGCGSGWFGDGDGNSGCGGCGGD